VPLLFKPVAQSVIGHKLPKLSKLRIKRLPINRKVMNHQIGNWVIARLTVWHTTSNENSAEKICN
jgi:hypothetical protein